MDLIIRNNSLLVPNLVHQPPKEDHGSIILPEIMIKGNKGRHPNIHNPIKSLLRGPAHKPVPISRRIAEIIKIKVIGHLFTRGNHRGALHPPQTSTATHDGQRQRPKTPYPQNRCSRGTLPNANGCPRPAPSHDPHRNTSGNASSFSLSVQTLFTRKEASSRTPRTRRGAATTLTDIISLFPSLYLYTE